MREMIDDFCVHVRIKVKIRNSEKEINSGKTGVRLWSLDLKPVYFSNTTVVSFLLMLMAFSFDSYLLNSCYFIIFYIFLQFDFVKLIIFSQISI